MGRIRETALVGAIMIVGILAGVLYVHTVGGQTRLSLSDGLLKTPEERIAMENQAIEIALSDPRVKPLVEGKEVRILSSFYIIGKLIPVYENGTVGDGGTDGKYRAQVHLIYPDNTGYVIDVNITDKAVGEPLRGILEDGGKIFKLIP